MSACTECGRDDISSNKKMCPSCEQKMICKERTTSSSGAYIDIDTVSNGLAKAVISDDDDKPIQEPPQKEDYEKLNDIYKLEHFIKLCQDHPPKEDCPICMLPMPYASGVCKVHTTYMPS